MPCRYGHIHPTRASAGCADAITDFNPQSNPPPLAFSTTSTTTSRAHSSAPSRGGAESSSSPLRTPTVDVHMYGREDVHMTTRTQSRRTSDGGYVQTSSTSIRRGDPRPEASGSVTQTPQTPQQQQSRGSIVESGAHYAPAGSPAPPLRRPSVAGSHASRQQLGSPPPYHRSTIMDAPETYHHQSLPPPYLRRASVADSQSSYQSPHMQGPPRRASVPAPQPQYYHYPSQLPGMGPISDHPESEASSDYVSGMPPPGVDPAQWYAQPQPPPPPPPPQHGRWFYHPPPAQLPIPAAFNRFSQAAVPLAVQHYPPHMGPSPGYVGGPPRMPEPGYVVGEVRSVRGGGPPSTVAPGSSVSNWAHNIEQATRRGSRRGGGHPR